MKKLQAKEQKKIMGGNGELPCWPLCSKVLSAQQSANLTYTGECPPGHHCTGAYIYYFPCKPAGTYCTVGG